MSSQPDQPKSKPESKPKSKSKPKSSSTPELPRSKFDDVLDNTNPADLDPLERRIFEGYKNARTLAHQSVKSHNGFKHSSIVNPAWTERYGGWDAEQFSIDNQNKRDRGEEKRKRDKDKMAGWGSSAQSESSRGGTSIESTSRGRSTTTGWSTRDSSVDSGIDMSYDDDTTEKSKYGQPTNTSAGGFDSSLQALVNDGRATLEARKRNRERELSVSSRSTSQSPTSRTSRSDSRYRDTGRSTGYESHSQATSQVPRRRHAPTMTDSGYADDFDDAYVPKYNGRNTTLRPIQKRRPAHQRRDSTVGWNDDRSEVSFRKSDPPTEVRPGTAPSTDSDGQEYYDATEYSDYDDTSRRSGWTIGTAAKLAATGAAAYGAYRLYQDPTLITDHVNTDTLHTARDLASGVASNAYTGVTDMASGVASGISSYAGTACDTMGTVGGALVDTAGGLKDTLGSTVAGTMSSMRPAWDVASGYAASGWNSVANTVDKHQWLASMAPGMLYNGTKLYLDYGR